MLVALLACAAAALLGGSSVAQRRAMPPTPVRGPGEPGLITGLLRQGWWWAGALALAGACAAVMAAAVTYARRRSAPGHAFGLALATGVGYGVTAIQLKTVSAQLGASGLALLTYPACGSE